MKTLLRNIFITALSVLFTTTLLAQQFITKQYKVENGLPTDIVKAITQDKDGNLWIATDEGFAKYNGARFETYPRVTHSNYTKGFYRTTKGRLLAFGDLDLFEIDSKEDTIEFRTLVPVSQAPNDSTLSYPKLLYEDREGSLWVSESQAVVKVDLSTNGDKKKIKRYEFGIADRTPQFIRSFSFFEDGHGDLYAVSIVGNVFQYNREKDQFVSSPYKFPREVEFASVINHRLIIGAVGGLYTAELSSEGIFGKPHLVSAIPMVSFVASLANGSWLVVTHGSEHFLFDSDFKQRTIAVKNVSDVNHIYLSNENDIWLSSNDGMYFMQEATFQPIPGNSNLFIECIAEDPGSQRFFYATRSELHVFDPASKVDKLIPVLIKDSYFQSLVSTEQGLWAANSFRVVLIKGENIVKTFDFSDQRMFVTSLNGDLNGNIWLTIPGRRQVLMIDKDLQLNSYGIPLGENGFINAVTDGGDGIYVASNGIKNYLFYKAYSDTVFHNISLPLKDNGSDELNATSLFVNGKKVWLATTAGLIKYDHVTAEKVFLGETYTGMPVRSLCPNGQEGFLVATSKDLIYYDVQTSDYNLYASARNLSGITINSRSLLISKDKRVWIGTSKNIFSSRRLITEKQKTMQPRFIFASIDSKRTAIPDQREVPYNILLSLTGTSVTFPEEERVFEFRFTDDGPWQRLGGSTVNIITSSPGDQGVQIRARKTGTYDWSDVTNLNFSVPTPFWMTKWFYVVIALFIALIILLTTMVVRAFHIKQKLLLEAKVAERTVQLEAANKELEGFSYSVSHDLRAPLRSVIGFSQILQEEHMAGVDEEGLKALSTIRKNANKMNQLIDDLLRFSRVLHQGLQKSEVDNDRLVGEIVSSVRETGNKETVFRIPPLPTVSADPGLITQVWSNLISNAVKYSSKASQPQVDIACQETANEYIFSVKDNGAGFDMQFAAKLFGVFQRLHTDREFPGTGIGLALVRRIVTRHGGRIWAEGKVNEGATFYFSVPK